MTRATSQPPGYVAGTWTIDLALDRRGILAGNDIGIKLLIVCHPVTSRREGGRMA